MARRDDQKPGENGGQLSKADFSSHVTTYLERSNLAYLPSLKTYQATIDDLYRQHGSRDGNTIDVGDVQKRLTANDNALFDAQLQRIYKLADSLPPKSPFHASPSRLGGWADKPPPVLLENTFPLHSWRWLHRFVAYVKAQGKYLIWLLLLLTLYCGMCVWMVFVWKDHVLRKALGWQLVTAKCGAQVGARQIQHWTIHRLNT